MTILLRTLIPIALAVSVLFPGCQKEHKLTTHGPSFEFGYEFKAGSIYFSDTLALQSAMDAYVLDPEEFIEGLPANFRSYSDAMNAALNTKGEALLEYGTFNSLNTFDPHIQIGFFQEVANTDRQVTVGTQVYEFTSRDTLTIRNSSDNSIVRHPITYHDVLMQNQIVPRSERNCEIYTGLDAYPDQPCGRTRFRTKIRTVNAVAVCALEIRSVFEDEDPQYIAPSGCNWKPITWLSSWRVSGRVTAKWRRIFKRTRTIGDSFDYTVSNSSNHTKPLFYAAGSKAGFLTGTNGSATMDVTFRDVDRTCTATVD